MRIVSPNSEVTNNYTVVFRLKETGDSGVKKFKQEGTKVQLIPDNSNYDISVHDIREFSFIHKVVIHGVE